MNRIKMILPIFALLALGACAQAIMPTDPAIIAAAPGFWAGLWHGFIMPFSFVGSLFNPAIAIYSVPNNGGWYDFGFWLGVGAFGSGLGGLFRE